MDESHDAETQYLTVHLTTEQKLVLAKRAEARGMSIERYIVMASTSSDVVAESEDDALLTPAWEELDALGKRVATSIDETLSLIRESTARMAESDANAKSLERRAAL